MPADPLHIDVGSLRHEVTIQAPSTTKNAYGESIATWANVLTTRAAIQSTNSAAYKDQFAQNALAAQSTYVVTMRHPGSQVDIKTGMRLIYHGDTYVITSLDNVLERNRVLRLACVVINGDSN